MPPRSQYTLSIQELKLLPQRPAGVLLDRPHRKTHAVFRRDHHVHMHMILVDPDLREMPVEIVFPYLQQLDPQVLGNALDKDLAAVSGHPHNVVLRLVARVGCFVQFHACQSTGRRGTLLTPPPLQAGTSRWIRKKHGIKIKSRLSEGRGNLFSEPDNYG